MTYVERMNPEILKIDNTVAAVANKFIDLGILKEESLEDCRHLAFALLNDCDYLVSWNFNHIVNVKTQRGVRIIAAIENRDEVKICAPTFLVAGDEN